MSVLNVEVITYYSQAHKILISTFLKLIYETEGFNSAITWPLLPPNSPQQITKFFSTILHT